MGIRGAGQKLRALEIEAKVNQKPTIITKSFSLKHVSPLCFIKQGFGTEVGQLFVDYLCLSELWPKICCQKIA